MSIFFLGKKKKKLTKKIRVSRVGPNANDDSNLEQAANLKKKIIIKIDKKKKQSKTRSSGGKKIN